MNCASRAKRHRTPAQVRPLPTRRAPSPRIVAVFRRPDQTICHARCGRSLSLQGVRGLIEADFYCYSCLAHVTIPLIVLDSMPVVPAVETATAMEAR